MTFRTAAVSMTFWVLGCASTNVQATWKADQPPPQQIRKFVVFGVTGSPSGRISFEETLTKSLQQAGLPAIPGYDFVAYDEYPDRSEVTRRLQEKGVDGVLVTRIESQTDDIQSTPVIVATGVPAYGYYDYWMAPAVAYGTYTTETTTSIVSTVLFDLTSARAYWMARASTTRTNPVKFATDLEPTVAQGLKSSGFIAVP
ncbi:MAG: hypothetical protein ACXWLF_05570 [Myxococcaceae bacterium]